ncbi:MAG: hypothetical protein FWG14_07700 [Peptococcaceae bacterium]|nr:hypothetical protein [Peptococcaceae bacterium]
MADKVTRDFSDAAKTTVIETIQKGDAGNRDVRERWDMLARQYNDVFPEIYVYIGPYFEALDLIQYTKAQGVSGVDTAFANINRDDQTWAGFFGKMQTNMSCIKKDFGAMANVIKPAMGGPTLLTVSPLVLQRQLANIDSTFINMAANRLFEQLVIIDANGNRTYNWPEIDALIQKDLKETAEWELLALVKVTQSMTVVKDDGTVQIDTDNFSKLIEHGYSHNWQRGEEVPKVLLELSPQFFDKHTLKMWPVFEEVAKRYIDETIATNMSGENMKTLFNLADSEKRGELSAELDKALILQGLITNHSEITFHTRFNGSDPIWKMNLAYEALDGGGYKYNYQFSVGERVYNFNILGQKMKENYRDDWLGSPYKGELYGFAADPSAYIKDNAINVTESLRRNRDQELAVAALKLVMLEAGSNSISGTGVSGSVLTLPSGIVDLLALAREIDTHNSKVDEIIRDIELADFVQAFKVASNVEINDGIVTMNGAYINEAKLANYLRLYNLLTGSTLTLEQAERGAAEILLKGKSAADANENARMASEYSDWHKKHIDLYGELEGYKNNQNFKEKYPDFPQKSLKELSDAEIQELYEIYKEFPDL